MKYSYILFLVFSISHNAIAKEQIKSISIIYNYGEKNLRAQLTRKKDSYEAYLKSPEGKIFKSVQSQKSIDTILSNLQGLTIGGYSAKCHRNHITFVVNEGSKSKNYSTCIGARNKQATSIINLFNASVAALVY